MRAAPPTAIVPEADMRGEEGADGFQSVASPMRRWPWWIVVGVLSPMLDRGDLVSDVLLDRCDQASRQGRFLFAKVALLLKRTGAALPSRSHLFSRTAMNRRHVVHINAAIRRLVPQHPAENPLRSADRSRRKRRSAPARTRYPALCSDGSD